jgi:AraC-like DNA-binding protein
MLKNQATKMKDYNSQSPKYWINPGLPGVELLRAAHKKQRFTKHYHRRFALGCVTKGALGFSYLGRNFVAGPGTINLALPQEPHTGHPALAEGWSYRMFYLEPELMSQAFSHLTGKKKGMPFFNTGVIHDPDLAQKIANLHLGLELFPKLVLEHQSKLIFILSTMIKRHATDGPQPAAVSSNHSAVKRAKEYMEAHFDLNPGLDQLSRATGLSRYHLARVFTHSTGIPPHAFLYFIRIKNAKEQIKNGHTLSQAALLSGFGDQSHLNRVFKKLTGITPGQYSKAVQD